MSRLRRIIRSYWSVYLEENYSSHNYFSGHVVISSHLVAGLSLILLVANNNIPNNSLIHNELLYIGELIEFSRFSFLISATFLAVEYGRDWCIKWSKKVHNKSNPEHRINIFYFTLYILFLSYSDFTDSDIGFVIGATIVILAGLKRLYELSKGLLLLRIADVGNWILAILFILVASVEILLRSSPYDYLIFYTFCVSLIVGTMGYYEDKLDNPITSLLFIFKRILIQMYRLLSDISIYCSKLACIAFLTVFFRVFL